MQTYIPQAERDFALWEVELSPLTHVDADRIPALYLARLDGAEQADAIYQRHMESLRQGNWDHVPIPVDPLGTAQRLQEARDQHGKDSDEYRQLDYALELDCDRLLAEGVSANRKKYFPEVFHKLDDTTAEYFAQTQPMLDLLAGGLSPIAEPEERERRKNEFVEEITYRTIGRLTLQSTVSTTERETSLEPALPTGERRRVAQSLMISECPDWVIEKFNRDPKGSFGGYVPRIRKFKIRGINFYNDKTRGEEELAMPGMLVDHEVIVETLQELGLLASGETPNKTELQAKQFVSLDGEEDALFQLAEHLDRRAGEKHGKNVFLGEEVSWDHPKDYEAVRAEAQQQATERDQQTKELKKFIIGLTDRKIDRWQADPYIQRFIKPMLFEDAKRHPEKAADIFDQETAAGLAEVRRLESVGKYAEADRLARLVEENAPDIDYCGGGSCGLEFVAPGSEEAKAAKEKGTDSAADLLKDTIRRCPDCNELTIVYDTKNKKKICTNRKCSATTDY